MIHLAFAGIVGIIFAAWWGNQNKVENVYDGDGNFYDALPGYYYYHSDEYRNQYYGSNLDEATGYINDIVEDCGELDITDSCWNQGNRFSVVYAFAATTMILLAVNSALMIAGAWVVSARLCASCCGCLCCCLNFASIITTGVFRFNSWGKLSAICEGPSYYDKGFLPLSDDRTVSGDATLIVWLWVCQMIFCCTHCCHTINVGKKS